jgi:DNA processing protein
LLRPSDPLWPTELDPIEAPPTELWARGCCSMLAPHARVAIVGSRAPTPYGLAQAERFAGALAAAGVQIVSGLARGCDAAAHAATLDAGGATIAVLGSGIDRPWPNDGLTRRVLEAGCLLSEYAPGTPSRRHHFPLRNRLISGLSSAVLVVEAAERSGSLITARWAADQGRTVFAVPGRVDHPMARGAHRLILDGATLVQDPVDVLRELGWERQAPAAGGPALSPLLEHLRGETRSASELASLCRRALPEVLAELAAAELDGSVRRAPGGLYQLVG